MFPFHTKSYMQNAWYKLFWNCLQIAFLDRPSSVTSLVFTSRQNAAPFLYQTYDDAVLYSTYVLNQFSVSETTPLLESTG